MAMFNPPSQTLTLERFAYSPVGTFGRLGAPDGPGLYTVEPPWRGNRVRVSCIPEGIYRMGLRWSGVVQRTTGGDYERGWEVEGVTGRSYIMIHPGNTDDATEGCICPGDRLGVAYGEWAVRNSRQAFDELMARLQSHDRWWIDVRPYRIEWP